MKKEKLSAADLALYLSAGIKVQFVRHGETYTGELCGCQLHWAELKNVVGQHASRSVYCITSEEVFSPTLRPLSDLTEDEIRHCFTIMGKSHIPSPGIDWTASQSRRISPSMAAIGCPLVWTYLLSIGIDLFAWIEAGLAIDKTKMETP